MIREGAVAGVILFAENLPSRAAGRRLIAELQAIPRPPGLRDPLLVMVDQEGGLVKRIDGAPTASAARDGRPRRRLQPRAGGRTAANLRDVGVNVDLAPVLDVARPGRRHRRDRTRLRLDAGPGRRHRRPLRRRRSRAAGSRRPGSTSPASAAPGSTPTSRSSGSASRRPRCAGSTRRPTGASSPRGGEMVMLSTAIYPAFSPKPAAFAPPIATGELREPPRLRGCLDHRRARQRRRRRTSAARRRRGSRRREPAPTSSSSPTGGRVRGPSGPCCTRCGRGRSRAPGSRPRPAGSCACATSWAPAS